MKDLIQNLKEQIKDKKSELARLEKALVALEPEKAPPKAKTTTARATPGGAQTPDGGTASAGSRSLPDRIIASLAARDDQGADSLAQELQAPLGQVRTVCSRLAREGRISSRRVGKQTTYLALKSEQPTDNPFSETN